VERSRVRLPEKNSCECVKWPDESPAVLLSRPSSEFPVTGVARVLASPGSSEVGFELSIFGRGASLRARAAVRSRGPSLEPAREDSRPHLSTRNPEPGTRDRDDVAHRWPTSATVAKSQHAVSRAEIPSLQPLPALRARLTFKPALALLNAGPCVPTFQTTTQFVAY